MSSTLITTYLPVSKSKMEFWYFSTSAICLLHLAQPMVVSFAFAFISIVLF